MALTINTSTEQKQLTQTPLLKIWVPWMGCNLNRRRGCKCSGNPAQLEWKMIGIHYLFCLAAVCSASALTCCSRWSYCSLPAVIYECMCCLCWILSPPGASGLSSVRSGDAGRQAAVWETEESTMDDSQAGLSQVRVGSLFRVWRGPLSILLTHHTPFIIEQPGGWHAPCPCIDTHRPSGYFRGYSWLEGNPAVCLINYWYFLTSETDKHATTGSWLGKKHEKRFKMSGLCGNLQAGNADFSQQRYII